MKKKKEEINKWHKICSAINAKYSARLKRAIGAYQGFEFVRAKLVQVEDCLSYFIGKTYFLICDNRKRIFLVPATGETTSQTKVGNNESATESATTQFLATSSATLSTLSKSLSAGANSEGKNQVCGGTILICLTGNLKVKKK